MSLCSLLKQLTRPKGLHVITTFTRQTTASSQANEYRPIKNNADICPSSTFTNRNPRNLELIARAHKDIGWTRTRKTRQSMNMPNRAYYNRILLRRSNRQTAACLENYIGNEIVSASTLDWYIRKQLYKSNDVMAASAVGKVLMEKCLRAGYSCAVWTGYTSTGGEAKKMFYNAIKSQKFMLQEPSQITNRYSRQRSIRKKPLPPEID